ncbi:hypothetical protein EUGRSUZ_D02058 [Eucalyptus grandis]|uniref:CBF1-interacting co-repressor CIR N-terminal domain-containing protein n=1 Tax=Eucalyptus grandis TaxID=71139 RepID=A0A059CHM6_EUCGR|nr:hypothetical protein EUGRSUZ_D02058 [Eucalyptus grandis]
MDGHGDLNILPQKRWNVYNYENREKVRKDEEAAVKEEQPKREQARKHNADQPAEAPASQRVEPAGTNKKSGHINVFEGIKIFDPVELPKNGAGNERDEVPKVVTAEDEKYRLGYGIAGKGVKLPWYLEKRGDHVDGEKFGDEGPSRDEKEQGKKSGKKTLEELREERMKREKQEKERARSLMLEKSRRDGNLLKDKGFQRR